ncbi:MAG: glycosyltransferase [Chlorobi bacterium]|nr:glycosyltransferase [Chlorobiota bacterium]
MKIVIVGTLPPFRGGIAHFNYTLAKYLSERHEVKGINFTTQYPNVLFPGKTQFEESTTDSEINQKRLLSSVNPLSWFKTASEIVNLNPDLIIFKYWMPFFAPAFGTVVKWVKRKTDVKILVICDNVIPHENRPFDNKLTRYFFNHVDHFIVMSEVVKKDLLSLYPRAHYSYAPHPVYNIFGDSIDTNKAREILGIKSEKVILYFGLIRKYKGLDLLIKAASVLRNKLENFTILIAGECYEDPGKYQALVKENELETVVDLKLQFIPDKEVAVYFSAADIVVLPYRSATQSGIVQIAYHFDRPVIVTNVGGLPEIVPQGDVGYVVEVNDPEAIADALTDFYRNNRYHQMVEKVREYKKRFSWEEFVKKIEELVD